MIERVDIAPIARVKTSSIDGYDRSSPFTAVRISDEDDRSDFLVEIRKLARPEPAYGWLAGSPIAHGDACADSPVPTTAQHRRRRNGLHKTESGLDGAGGVKQVTRRATRRLPDGSGLLPARHVARDRTDITAAERPAVGERWLRG